MANKYHYNKETGRANICRVKEGGVCPLGSDVPHFDNKADAKAYIEKDAAENNETFAPLSKKQKLDDVRLVVEDTGDDVGVDEFGVNAADSAEKYALSVSASDSYSPKEVKTLKKFIASDDAFSESSSAWSNTLRDTLTAEVDEDDNDAYEGDDYGAFDYADNDGFPRFTGMVDFDSAEVVDTYYKHLKKGYGNEELNKTEEKQVKYTIKKVMSKHGLLEPLNYTAVTSYDSVDYFECAGDTRGALNELSSVFNS